MIVCAAGDAHGAIERLYTDVQAFEEARRLRFTWVLQVGDLGVWSSADRIDRATRKHGGAGEFASWHAQGRPVPRPTVFIKGNHEDHGYLQERRVRGQLELLPGLTFLPNGETVDLGTPAGPLRVGGIGGCHGPSNYERSSLHGRARRHFTRAEVERLCEGGRLDVLLLHDAPAGIGFSRRRPDGSTYVHHTSEAHGLTRVIEATRPAVCVFGHHHTRLEAEVSGVRCIGLNRVPHQGSLVAIELTPGAGTAEVIGEWPCPAHPESPAALASPPQGHLH